MKRRVYRLVISLCLMLLLGHSAQAAVRPGDTGEAVRALQRSLNAQGYSLAVDGKYGQATEAAVLAFQRAKGLKPDGVAGTQTQGALGAQAPVPPVDDAAPVSDAAPDTTPQDAAPETPALPVTTGRYQEGSVGPGVVALQLRLAVLGFQPGRTDGVFDRGTRAAVIAFQRQQGLKQDGIAGRDTLGRLHQSAQSPAEPSQPGADPAPAPAQGGAPSGKARVQTGNGGSLRLRSSASDKDSKNVLGSLRNGLAVEVLGTQGGWTRVRALGQEGYVMSRYLAAQDATAAAPSSPASPPNDPAPTVPTPAEGAKGKATVHSGNGKVVNLRSSPENRGNANHVNQVRAGETVEVLSYGPTWSQIRYRGQACYIMTSFLRVSELVPPPAQEQPQEPDGEPGKEEEDEIRFSRILRSGMEGADVSALQARLDTLRYGVTATGRYDGATIEAVRGFQRANGLGIDGVAGPATIRTLFSQAARESDKGTPTFTTLRMGARDGAGSAVTMLQTALKGLGFPLSVDGSYGAKTHDAVVGFQQRNGLTVSGIADALTQSLLYSGSAKGADAPVPDPGGGAPVGSGPDGSQVKLLDWYSQVKPQIKSGQTARVYHPQSGISFDLQYYSLGRHADSEPKTLKDTQLMNQAFGAASWDTRSVYVKMPNGDWTLATMHNYPHLHGSISDNGFGGHLCVHFKRDLAETKKVDPNYGLQNQTAIRKTWERITGEQIN